VGFVLLFVAEPGAGAPKASLEACKAREAPELVAQGVGVLVLAAGGGEVDEYVGEGPDAGGFPGDGLSSGVMSMMASPSASDQRNPPSRSQRAARW
jgi:hypothetical protein